MNRFIPLKQRLWTGICLAVVVVVANALLFNAVYAGGDAKSDKPPQQAAAPQKLSGADLYAIHCNRCHAERYPKEFTASQWKTLMIHMRVRANIPASQANEILKYLQEESGS